MYIKNIYILMPFYNMLEYSHNYSMTLESLWNYYRDELNDVNGNISNSKSFEYKTKIVGKTFSKF